MIMLEVIHPLDGKPICRVVGKASLDQWIRKVAG
jgi:hypothetical protein